MRVREAGDADRHHLRPRLLVGDEPGHGLPQGRPQSRACSALPLAPIELVLAVAEPVLQHLPGLGLRLPGQQPTVDGDLAQRGDDVALLRRLDHGRRHRERQKGLEHLGCDRIHGASRVERLGRGRHPTEHRLQERLRLRAETRLGRELAQPLEQRRSLDERVVGNRRHRRVTGPPVHQQTEGRAHLLRRRAQVDDLASELAPRRDAHGTATAIRSRRPRRAPRPPWRRRSGRPRAESPRVRARRSLPRSPPPAPSCRAHRGPRRRRRAALPTTDRPSTRPGRRAPCPCARGGAGSAPILAPGRGQPGWRAPAHARTARTGLRSPQGSRAAARPPASRFRED